MNANRTIIAICELLVARGLVREVVLSRLPVGHTHEDIDGIFALIWRRMRDLSIITPQEYARVARSCISGKEHSQKFVDLFCLPDYETFLAHHIDSKFGRCFKEHWTQLVFRFRRVDVYVDFPLGVETHYRAYSQDKAVEIMDNPAWGCGQGARIVECDWEPKGKGIYILKSLPDGIVPPMAFVAGARADTERSVAGILKSYADHANTKQLYETWLQHRSR